MRLSKDEIDVVGITKEDLRTNKREVSSTCLVATTPNIGLPILKLLDYLQHSLPHIDISPMI